ncbi:PREDICTED: NAC domain-containing protein 6-like [Camelina sativa]|uniref:NAC domain-containing protein 6-like n=1 Tax=Camelina sativa TaxID=90675 RepID=A0ABM1R5S6_CAMSA|nr:PREDICTED: NAC domain-containing protein 6-like [Camelina sativa]
MGKPYHHLVGSRFVPNDLGLLRYHLRSMVERKQSSVDITTMDVYQSEPWLLPHVSNPLFKKKEWYYVFPKTKTPSRSVLGRGGSKVGCWRSGVKKIDIKDGNKIIGYKKSLTYHTIVHGEKKKTDWLMTEYSLHKVGDGFQDLVLCMIRDKTKTKVDKRINHVPQTQTQPRPHSQYQLQPQPQPQVAAENTNNILPNQLVHKEAVFTGFAEELETIMLEGQEDREATEQQQEDEIPQIHDNNNNVMMSNQQVQKEADLTGFADELETIMLEGQEDRDINEQQQEEEIPMIPLAQIHENNKNVMMSNQQVQEEAADLTCFADELETIMLEGDGDDATEQVQEDAGLACLSNELDMLMQQQQIYEETQSGNNEVIPTPPPMQNNNNNKSDIIMRLGGQEEREFTQQQQKQLEEVLPIPPPMHNNNNNNNDDVMMKWRQELSDIEEFLLKDNEGEDVTEQEERFQLLVQPIYQAQEWSQLVGDQENDTMMIIDNPNNAQALGNFEFIDV